MVITRSSSMHEPQSTLPEELNELQIMLLPISAKIQEINVALDGINKLFEKKFLVQKHQIANLQTRMSILEGKMAYQEFVTDLHDRKLDDLEQTSRKVNLKLKNIALARGDSPQHLMDIIKMEIQAHELDIPDEEIDRCHRDGKPYFRNNIRVQDVLVRFRTWRTRDIMYNNRKMFSFTVAPDLTKRRVKLLNYLKEQCMGVENEPNVATAHRIVDFVYCDKNCKIKFKSKMDRFYTISSELEFLNLIQKLDHFLSDSDFKTDEKNRDNYGRYEEEVSLNEIYY